MLFYIITMLTAILAVAGILVQTRTEKGKIKWTIYPIVALIGALAIIQCIKEYSDDKTAKNKELNEIKKEQQKHGVLLNQLINNSKPITKLRFYYEFSIDTSLQDVKNVIQGRRKELLESRRTKPSEFGFNIHLENPTVDILSHSKLLTKIGNSTFFFLDILSQDSLSIQFQSGYSTPQKWYDIELLVTKDDYATIRFTDLRPSTVKSDMGFNSLYQMKNAIFELTPNISPENEKLLGSLLSFIIENEEGNTISSTGSNKSILEYGAITFTGTLN